MIGERVRDKIAASKQKGLWVGGPIPLGYRSQNKRLVVEETEAELVRRIFMLYRQLGSVGALVERLAAEGIRSRKGYRFGPGAISALLKNRFYLGEVVWKGQIHAGEHEATIDRELFEAVQAQIADAAVERRRIVRSRVAILTGLLDDDAGNRMSPSHSSKDGVRYRYYVSSALLRHDRARAGTISRVSAPEVEGAVRCAIGGSDLSSMERITLHRDRLTITFIPTAGDTDPAPVTVPFAWQSQGRRKGIVHEPAIRPRIDHNAAHDLLVAIARARRWMAELIDGSIVSTDAIAVREAMGERNVRKLLPLACLAPAVIRAIADGSAPADLTIRKLTAALPHDWTTQERQLLVA